MAITRKNYQAIADALRTARINAKQATIDNFNSDAECIEIYAVDLAIDQVISGLMIVLKKDNPNFSSEKFTAAINKGDTK